MIDVKKAAQISADYMKGFFPESDSIRLEEVEITDDKKFWIITLSYSQDDIDQNSPFLGIKGGKIKKYKIFKIKSESGEVLSMKIREFK